MVISLAAAFPVFHPILSDFIRNSDVPPRKA